MSSSEGCGFMKEEIRLIDLFNLLKSLLDMWRLDRTTYGLVRAEAPNAARRQSVVLHAQNLADQL